MRAVASLVRGQLLRLLAAAAMLFLAARPGLCVEQGSSLAGLQAFDSAVQAILGKWEIPGASLAVAKDGRLLLAKGYGWADKEQNQPVRPDTLFRMGSINKTLTAVLVLKMVEDGRLTLDQPVLPILEKAGLRPASIGDPRSKTITVRQLLQHSAGFDREISGDPFFPPHLGQVARRQKTEPVTCEAIVKDALERQLDFGPGQRFAYSNTGYCMLGKVIEAVAGEPFARLVSRQILMPVIGKDFRSGASQQSAPGETKYHAYPGERLLHAAPGLASGLVPSPYGSYSIENMEASGAWIATPTDVAKFFLAIDGTRGARLLSQASMFAMLEAPVYASGPTPLRRYYGMGVNLTKGDKGVNWWHAGSQPGVYTLALRTWQGYTWVVAFNARPAGLRQRAFFADFDEALWNASRSVQHWPQGDLF
jgi:CubicO group peptidase (beta-lactamase class C family)